MDDNREHASAAGLRYVTDESPGLRRRRCGRGFSYLGLDGKRIRDPAVRRRIEALAIPPAWTDVWISADPRGHVQATGRDDQGRKQYRYHPRWNEVRNETKFDRMAEFGSRLPRLRMRVAADLARGTGLSRDRVLATVVRLLERSCIRVGSDEYRRRNGSYGLTTMRRRHVDVNGSEIRFRFRGKAGKRQEVVVDDPRVAGVLRRAEDLPGYELFQYRNGDGQYAPVDAGEVNDYIREHSGESFTAKDFRTWAGTVHALHALRQLGEPTSKADTRKKIVAAVDHVARELRNTRSVCRSAYIHPAVPRLYEEGRLLEVARPGRGRRWLEPEEVALLRLLRELAD